MGRLKLPNPARSPFFRSILIHYTLSPKAILALSLLPFLLFFMLSFFSLPICYDLHPYLWGEGKIVETTQFIILLIATLNNLVLSWRTTVLGEKRIIRAFYLLFGLGMLFIAGEEVAWGQQFLNFKTPDFLQVFNTQNEFTFHNLGALQGRSDRLNLFFAAAGWFGIYLAARGYLKKISTPVLLAPWLSLILALAVFGIYFKLHLGARPLNYPAEYVFHIQTETTELLIAIVGFLYPWLNHRRFFTPTNRGGLLQTSPSPENLSLFPLKRSFTLVSLASGISCMVWFAIIPGEVENNFLLGLSRTRFFMITIGLVICLVIACLTRRAARDPEWRESASRRLNRLVMNPPFMWTLSLTGCLGFVASGTTLVITYTQTDPFFAGILNRLAPWLLWALVLSLEVLLLTAPRLLPLARSRLPDTEVDFDTLPLDTPSNRTRMRSK